MLTKPQVARLRGLIARHSRCQWNMGATQSEHDKDRTELVAASNKAREALFAELRALTAEEIKP